MRAGRGGTAAAAAAEDGGVCGRLGPLGAVRWMRRTLLDQGSSRRGGAAVNSSRALAPDKNPSLYDVRALNMSNERSGTA